MSLKHLSYYLPHGLQVRCGGGEVVTLGFHNYCKLSKLKPALRPVEDCCKEEFISDLLSILNESAEYNTEFVSDVYPIQLSILNDFQVNYDPFCTYASGACKYEVFWDYEMKSFSSEIGRIETTLDMYEWLFSKHFDVFNLINNDLAININEL